MRFPPVDLGTGPWSKRTVASQIENFGPMSGAQRPRGSKGEVSLDNADAVIDGATLQPTNQQFPLVDHFGGQMIVQTNKKFLVVHHFTLPSRAIERL
jgi:hypothetical protein